MSYKLRCVIATSCHGSENLLLFFTKEHEEFFRRFSQQFTFKIELPKNKVCKLLTCHTIHCLVIWSWLELRKLVCYMSYHGAVIAIVKRGKWQYVIQFFH